MKYICKECNYETRDKSHFDRHKNTKKHVHNVQENDNKNICKSVCQPIVSHNKGNEIQIKQYICSNCDKTFLHRQSLHKHKSKCNAPSDTPIVKKLEKTIDKLEEQNKKLIDVIENQSRITKNTTDVAKTNSNIAKKSMNVLSYALNNYNDAPPVGLLEDDKFDKMAKCLIYDDYGNKKTNKSVEEIIIFHHRKDTLVKVLGELITNEYKKADPNKQSIWSSDISRLTFIVKDIIGETRKSKWITDKKGLHITQTIINPMMDIIKDKLIKYVKRSGNLINKSKIKDEEETKSLLSKMHDANLALLEIKLGKIHIEVLKQIAPYFNLSIGNIESEFDSSSECSYS